MKLNSFAFPQIAWSMDAGGAAAAAEEIDDTGADAAANDDAAQDAGAVDKGTALDAGADGDDDKSQSKGPSDFPEDWRERMAGGNEEYLKTLKRFSSPDKFTKSFFDTKAKLSAGPKKVEMPAEDDAEGMKAWRKENGIPDDPTGYAIPDDVKSMVTDADKPVLASFTEAMHKMNAPQNVVDLATKWYFPMQEEMAVKQAEADDEAKESTIDQMREEFGTDYKPNMQMAARYMETTGGVGRAWQSARLPADLVGEDGNLHPMAGRLLGNIPEFIKWAADEGRAKFGDLSFASGDAEQKHNTRKQEITKIMQTDYDAYRADAAMQQEYRQILEAEAKRSTTQR